MAKMTKHDKPRRNRREIDEKIDENLKRAFDQMAEEPLPDRFTELLNKLRDSQDGSNGS